MIDLAQFGTVAGLALITGLIIQILKGVLIRGNLNLIPLIAMVLATILAMIDGAAAGVSTPAGFATSALTGIAGGLTAVGSYEALRGVTTPRPPTTP